MDFKKGYMNNQISSPTTIWRVVEFSDILRLTSPGELYYGNLKLCSYLQLSHKLNIIYFNTVMQNLYQHNKTQHFCLFIGTIISQHPYLRLNIHCMCWRSGIFLSFLSLREFSPICCLRDDNKQLSCYVDNKQLSCYDC